MGKVDRPIRRQIIFSFYQLLILSVVATLLTWGVVAAIFIFQFNQVNPANYYEQQIPGILNSIEQSNGDLLSKEKRHELEKNIPLDGMDYQVLDNDGTLLYGSTSEQYVKNQKDLLKSFNKNLYDKKSIIKFYPVFDENDQQIGAIGFRYKLSLASANPEFSGFFILIGILTFASPFVYFSLFSYLIGRKFSRTIEKPFTYLMEAARKIQSQDLDFQLIESRTSKELNELVHAFEEMRIALKESLLRQWQLEEERKEMVAAIAHDLRTPLTIINGHIEGLLDGGENHPERLDRYLHTISASTQRTIRLIDQLNDVSAIDRREITIEPIPLNVVEFIQSKAREYKVLCTEKNITLECIFTLPDRMESKMKIDPYRISQVLDNIITNSIRYCPELNGVIEWKTTLDHNTILFELLDNGPGFQNKESEEVFKKFYREDPSRSGNDSNFGLGLYIAQTIVKKHNGEISVRNRPEGGAYTKVLIREIE